MHATSFHSQNFKVYEATHGWWDETNQPIRTQIPKRIRRYKYNDLFVSSLRRVGNVRTKASCVAYFIK